MTQGYSMRFNRIFWKIFTAIWLVNVLVVVCVVWVISSGHLRERMAHKHAIQVERLAEQLIARYERGSPVKNGRSAALKKIYRRYNIPPEVLITITNLQGSTIYSGHKRFNDSVTHKKRLLTLIIESEKGERYRVHYLPIKTPHSIGLALRDILSAQLLLMLVASAFLSALISWGITQPLKHLQLFSRRYQPAGTSLSIDQKLLRRGDELGDLARDIARMTAQVDAAFSAQEDLLHDVSHELRAPLARLQVGVALAELAAPNNAAIAKMHTQCERMNALIQRILEYSRLQSATQASAQCAAFEEPNTKTIAPINLQTLLVQVADDITFEFSDTVVSVYGNDHPAHVRGDPNLLQSALENLMRNACKHTPPKTPVELHLTHGDKTWQLTVRDYGPGVTEDPNNLLKPFYRAGGQMHTEGFGLGLSIAARAIKALGGTLVLTNHPEGGLEATINLPKG